MERRWNIRKNLYLNIALEVTSYNKRVVAAKLVDISPSGAFIETQVLLPDNAALVMEFKLPGKSVQNSFRLNARMVRRTMRGAGVVFVGMRASVINALSEALSQREKQLEPLKPDTLSGFGMHKALTS
jgi:hypothetical protein